MEKIIPKRKAPIVLKSEDIGSVVPLPRAEVRSGELEVKPADTGEPHLARIPIRPRKEKGSGEAEKRKEEGSGEPAAGRKKRALWPWILGAAGVAAAAVLGVHLANRDGKEAEKLPETKSALHAPAVPGPKTPVTAPAVAPPAAPEVAPPAAPAVAPPAAPEVTPQKAPTVEPKVKPTKAKKPTQFDKLGHDLDDELAKEARKRLEKYRTANVGFFPETCRQEEIKLREDGGDVYFGYETTSSPESKERTKKAMKAIQYALDHDGQPDDQNLPPVLTGTQWMGVLRGVPAKDRDKVILAYLRTFEDMAKNRQPNAEGVITVPDQSKWTQLAPDIRRVHGQPTDIIVIQDPDGRLRQIPTPEEILIQEIQERIEKNTQRLDDQFDEKMMFPVKQDDVREVWVNRDKMEVIYLNDRGAEIHVRGVRLPPRQ